MPSTSSDFQVPTRIPALDGMRGVAALVVVFHHVLLLNGGLANIFLNPGDDHPALGSPLWWLTATPLQLLHSGEEAVLVFFVLSGLVVALPALNPAFDWLAYYPRRVLRLMLPVVASVLLAALIIWLTPQDPATASSSWSAGSSIKDLGIRNVVLGIDLLGGDFRINNPLWSLHWELLFSLLLPIYIVIARALGRGWWIGMIVALGVIGAGFVTSNGALIQLPVFLLGTIIAVNLGRFFERTGTLRRRTGNLLFGGLLVVSAVALTARWILWWLYPHSTTALDIGRMIAVLGAFGFVAIAVFWRPLARTLEVRPVQWLGRISFSLYLVHVPIILGVSAFFGPTNWWLPGLIAIPIALVVAELFTRFVEAPSHRLSKTAGRASRRIVGSPELAAVTGPREDERPNA